MRRQQRCSKESRIGASLPEPVTESSYRASDEGVLPVFPTDSFIGRRAELTELLEALRGQSHPVTTVLGPGGVGKTRIALETLRDSEEWSGRRVALVSLMVAQNTQDVIRALSEALAIVDHDENLRRRILEALHEHSYLIFLDNLEHVIDEAREIVRWLLAETPGPRILTTSRIALDIADETTLELGPLQTEGQPDNGDPEIPDAVRLFLDRARTSNPRFILHDGDLSRVAELCQRYDGLPLAIELVASWANVLTPREMLDRHGSPLADQGVSREERHRTLNDAIRWSYDLLDEPLQRFFCRMSLFPGGFSRDLANRMIRGSHPGQRLTWASGFDAPWGTGLAAAWGDMPSPYDLHPLELEFSLEPLDVDSVRALATLLQHHLILPAVDVDGVLCFDMLETIRSFGMSELRHAGQIDGARQTQALAMVAFAEASGTYLWGVSDRRWGTDRIAAALPSIRTALHWLDQQGEAGQALIVRIAGPLWGFYQTRGMVIEGRRCLDLAMTLSRTYDWLRGIELPALAFLCWIQNDDERATAALDEAEAALGRVGYTHTLGLCHLVRALILYRQPNPDFLEVIRHIDQAEHHFSEWEIQHGIVGCRAIYGIVARLLGDTQKALDLFEEAHRIANEAGYEWGIAITRYFAGETLRELAAEDETRLPEAIAMMTEALDRTWSQRDAWSAGGTLSGLACICVQQGELLKAATMFGAASTLMERVGGSLLPADFLTHGETSERLRELMGSVNYDQYFAAGAASPEHVVEQTLREFAQMPGQPLQIRLTARQMAVLHDLLRGLDPLEVARRRGRSESATYEILGRMCERLGVGTWEEIVPKAIDLGIVERPD